MGVSWIDRPDAPAPPDYGPLAEAQKYAADLQYEAAQQGMEMWQENMDQIREDYMPYMKHGRRVLGEMKKLVDSGEFQGNWKKFSKGLEDWSPEKFLAGWNKDPNTQSPGYNFRMKEGMKAIKRQAATGGMATGGATLKALNRYGQDYASNEFNNAYNRARGDYILKRQGQVEKYNLGQQNYLDRYNMLAQQLGASQNALSQQTGFMQQGVGNMANLNMQGASALGAGQIGSANAIISGQNAKIKNWQLNQQADQQGFNNLMSIAGLAVGAGSGIGGSGMWGPSGAFG